MAVPFIDIHTHHSLFSDDIISVLSLFLQNLDSKQEINFPFTTGIHPWHASDFPVEKISGLLEDLSEQKSMLAVGEAGLDKKCGVDFSRQEMIFESQLQFASRKKYPVIIHNAGAWNEILSYSGKYAVSFIFHGFNGSSEIVKRLIRSGHYFSIGKNIMKRENKIREVIRIIPADYLFFETDDDKDIDIREVYKCAADLLGWSINDLKTKVYSNYRKLFSSM